MITARLWGERGDVEVAVGVPEVVWRKSSYSGPNGCVEVAISAHTVAVRDSKDRGGPALTFTLQEWTAFVAAVQDGEFNLSSG